MVVGVEWRWLASASAGVWATLAFAAAPAFAREDGPEVAAWAGAPGSSATSITLSEAYAVQVAFGITASGPEGHEGAVTVRADLAGVSPQVYLTAYDPACALAGTLLTCTGSWTSAEPTVTFVASVKPNAGTPAGAVGTIGVSAKASDDVDSGNNAATISVGALGPPTPEPTTNPPVPPSPTPTVGPPTAPNPPATTTAQAAPPEGPPPPAYTVPPEPTLAPGVTVAPNVTLTPGGPMPPGLSPSGSLIVTMPPGEPGFGLGPAAAPPFGPAGDSPTFTWILIGVGALALILASSVALISLRRATDR